MTINIRTETGEMTQCLRERVLVALAEDLMFVPSTHVRQLTSILNSSFKGI